MNKDKDFFLDLKVSTNNENFVEFRNKNGDSILYDKKTFADSFFKAVKKEYENKAQSKIESQAT